MEKFDAAFGAGPLDSGAQPHEGVAVTLSRHARRLPRTAIGLILAVTAATVAAPVSPAAAQTGNACTGNRIGDVYVVGYQSRQIARFDAVTGAQSMVTEAGNLVEPVDIARGGDGGLYVTSARAGAIVRVDPSTGGQTVVASGDNLSQPYGISFSGGALYVTERSQNAVVRVDPATGARNVISRGGLLGNPLDVAVGPDGQLYVTDAVVRGVVRIDPVTGVQTMVTAPSNLRTPAGAVFVGDSLYVIEGDRKSVV